MPTQQERANAARDIVNELYPKLDEARCELRKVLDEAQNPPPEGQSDGSMTEVQWKQHRAVKKALDDLILTHLFRTK
jgi:hypothetical protein